MIKHGLSSRCCWRGQAASPAALQLWVTSLLGGSGAAGSPAIKVTSQAELSWGEVRGNLRGGEWGLSGLPRARALRDLATPISPRELLRGSCTARNFGSILFLNFLSTCSSHLTTQTDFYQYFMSYVHMKYEMFNTALDLIRAKSKIKLNY